VWSLCAKGNIRGGSGSGARGRRGVPSGPGRGGGRRVAGGTCHGEERLRARLLSRLMNHPVELSREFKV